MSENETQNDGESVEGLKYTLSEVADAYTAISGQTGVNRDGEQVQIPGLIHKDGLDWVHVVLPLRRLKRALEPHYEDFIEGRKKLVEEAKDRFEHDQLADVLSAADVGMLADAEYRKQLVEDLQHALAPKAEDPEFHRAFNVLLNTRVVIDIKPIKFIQFKEASKKDKGIWPLVEQLGPFVTD